jgi:sulfane dehydrogenase subunit SoxC
MPINRPGTPKRLIAQDAAHIEKPGPYGRIPLLPHQLSDAITPLDQLFVLAHLGVATIDIARWKLEIGGLVGNPRTFSMNELRSMPVCNVQAFHQCAGDPKNPLKPSRRIANVVWTGVLLERLLDIVDVDPKATFLWSYGSDYGEFDGEYQSAYLKDLPLARLKEAPVILAYGVNGKTLPIDNGFPLRLVIPGWYGTNSVKWLSRIELADRRAESIFTTKLYNDRVAPTAEDPSPKPKPVWSIPVESVIVTPAPGTELECGRVFTVKGWAWADSGVAQTEVSIDGGTTWVIAKLGERIDMSWQPFEAHFVGPKSGGPQVITVNSRSKMGHVQPNAGARNEIHRIPVVFK